MQKNINRIFPVVKQPLKGNFIEFDFFENISEKPKWEEQSAHFSGIQYSLHCSIVEPGNEKDVYHISSDTTHNPDCMFLLCHVRVSEWPVSQFG